MPTIAECKSKVFKLGVKYGVNPKLISERLLSSDDKKDMVNGLISDEMLETAIQCWVRAGLPDYANGHTSVLKPFFG